jgi:hypothetical protein
MQDPPKPPDLLAAVARFLREELMPQLSGALAFQTRIAANVVELSRREMELGPTVDAAEHQRLVALLAQDGDLAALNRELCRRIREGEMTLETPGLAAHLWEVTLVKLAVDQPTFASYQRERARQPEPG